MNVAVLLPMYNDAAGKWASNYQKFHKHLKNLKGAYGNWVFCLNLQNMDEDTAGAVQYELEQETECEVFAGQFEYEKPIQLARIREDAANLIDSNWPDIYVGVDDDFIFRSGTSERYGQIVRFLEENETVGAVMGMGTFGGYRYGENILLNPGNTIWSTNRGLFCRNLKEEDWRWTEHDIFDHPGPLEDYYAVCCRVSRGYQTAKTFNVPVSNKNTRIDHRAIDSIKKEGRYPLEEAMHHPDLMSNVCAFLRQKYGDPHWDFWKRKFPTGCRS